MMLNKVLFRKLGENVVICPVCGILFCPVQVEMMEVRSRLAEFKLPDDTKFTAVILRCPDHSQASPQNHSVLGDQIPATYLFQFIWNELGITAPNPFYA